MERDLTGNEFSRGVLGAVIGFSYEAGSLEGISVKGTRESINFGVMHGSVEIERNTTVEINIKSDGLESAMKVTHTA